MAQNVTVAGASYTAVPSVVLPKTGGGTASFTDVTGTTALASDVASGKYFFTAQGVLTLGTSSGGGGGGITQDQNGYLVLSPTGGGGGASVTTYSAISNDTIDLDGATGSSLFTETSGYGIFARVVCDVEDAGLLPFYFVGMDSPSILFVAFASGEFYYMECIDSPDYLTFDGYVTGISGNTYMCSFSGDLYYSKIALT